MTISSDPKCYREIPEGLLRRLFDHQRWVATSGLAGTCLNAAHLDLQGYDLDGIDLSSACLARACFTGASLRQTKLRNTDLVEAAIISCSVQGADFTGAKLNKACFLNTDWKKAASYDRAMIERVVWSDDDLGEHLRREYLDFKRKNPDTNWAVWEYVARKTSEQSNLRDSGAQPIDP